MIIGLLSVIAHIPNSNSLKSKRSVIKSLKDKLHNRFNISIAEVDNHDKWQLATLAIAAVTTDKAHADSLMSSILNFIEEFDNIDIVEHRIELL